MNMPFVGDGKLVRWGLDKKDKKGHTVSMYSIQKWNTQRRKGGMKAWNLQRRTEGI